MAKYMMRSSWSTPSQEHWSAGRTLLPYIGAQTALMNETDVPYSPSSDLD